METLNKLDNLSGIYTIINTTNQKTYVGQTIDLEKRYKKHKSLLKNNKHWNKDLQRNYLKHRFVFKTVKVYKIKSLNRMEKFWIKKLNTFNGFGYNQTEGGDSFNIGKSNPSYNHTIYEFEHFNRQIFVGTQYELRIKFKLSSADLSGICSGKIKSSNGWGLKGWTKKIKNKNKFKIYTFEHIDGTVIKTTQSELRIKYDLKRNQISEVCSNIKKSTKGWGLKDWTKKVGSKFDTYTFKHTDGITFKGTQYELKTKFNLYSSHISQVCLGKRKSTLGWYVIV